MPSLFISHASEDKPFVKDMLSILAKMGVDFWFDQQEIRPGDSIPQKINEGLAKSTHGVVVLSDSYIRDGKYWTSEELWSLINIESYSNGRIIIPIRLGLSHHDLTKSIPLIAHRLSTDFIGNPGGAANEIFFAISESRKIRVAAGEDAPREGLPDNHNIPFSRPAHRNFIGREEITNSIINELENGRSEDISKFGHIVLSGIPGIGKTTIACEICYRISRQFTGGAYWIDGTSESSTVSSIETILKIFGISADFFRGDKPEDIIRRKINVVREKLECLPCIIVLDSIDKDFEKFHEILPKHGVSRTIMTTRARITPTHSNERRFDIEIPDESIASHIIIKNMERDVSSDEMAVVREICNELGRLPLALNIAGRYLRTRSNELNAYLDRLKNSGAKWRGISASSQTSPPIVDVIEQAIQGIKDKNEHGNIAAKLLYRCASISLTSDKIYLWDRDIAFPRDGYLPLGLASSVGISRDDENLADVLDDAIELLDQAGLIRANINDSGQVWIHNLTVKVAVSLFDEEDAAYVAYRCRVKWGHIQDVMRIVGWLDFSNDQSIFISSARSILKASKKAALSALVTAYEAADFADNKMAESVADEAITICSSGDDSAGLVVLKNEFMIKKAYSVYKLGRLSEALQIYESVEESLKSTGAHTLEFVDFMYFFGCLLLEVGGSDNRIRAEKLWETASEEIEDEISRLETINAPQQLVGCLKIRLLRIIEASGDVGFSTQNSELARKLRDDLSDALAHPFSWESQFVRARRPLVMFMTVRTVIKKE